MSSDPDLEPQTTRHLTHLLATAQREQRLPSVAAGIVRAGRLVWSDAIGTVDGRAGGQAAHSDTQYRMGSITKTFVAVLVMRLRDAGRLDLSDRFEEHVPGSALGGVTIAQLLSHGGGVQAETNGPWWERTHGVRWFEVVRRDLLEPMGMRRTTARPAGAAAVGLAVHPFADLLLHEPEHDAGAMAPAGQLWTTVEDLAKWAAFVAGDTGDLLSADTLAEMLEPHTVVDVPGLPWTGAHGLGWQLWNVGGVRFAGHTGSMPGFLAGLRVALDSGDGVVAFTNSTSAALGPTTERLLTEFIQREPRLLQPWHANGDAALLDLTGLWHWGAGVVTGRIDGRHFVLGEPGQARGSRFEPVGPDEWVGLDGYYTGEPLRVVRRPDGTVSHLDLASFRFTRTPYDPAADVPGGVDDLGWY